MGWLVIGSLSVIIGFVVIWFAGRQKSLTGDGETVSLNIDLPGEVNLDTMTCQSCGGTLTMENIKMVAGAPVVSCPYCKTSYQLSEEPKW